MFSFTLRYNTFWKRYKSVWSNVLRFQPATTHGCCDDCLDFKEKFKHTMAFRQGFNSATSGPKDAQQKFETVRAYKAHLDEVAQDRQLESYLEVRSRGSFYCKW